MDKSFLKYLLGGGLIFGGETFATLMDSDPRENLVTMLSQQSLPMLLLFQRIVDCLGSLPGTDEVKESAMGRFLETDLETNRERLKSMVAEEEKMVAKEKRIQALKAQFEKEFEEKDEEIR
ncbi:MAG: hypothetical protein LBJ13_01930, partial [Puniceicoccales bacterium]|nr:hypothetical protein [Puniceicoccales bacterium]